MKVTETASSVTFDEERRESRIFRRVVDLWPLWLVVLSGIAACFKFYFTVADLAEGQRKWQESSEARREKTHTALDDLDNRLIRLETDMVWVKKGK